MVGIVFAAQLESEWPRLKICASDECRWAFYDSSRNRSGTWCQDGDLREHDQEPGVPPAQDGLGDDRGLTAGDLRPATEADAAAVTRLVDDAYGHYVQRLGIRPGPMREDYGDVIRTRDATVVERGSAIVGLLVRGPTDERVRDRERRRPPRAPGPRPQAGR